jgi:hypothetical protein
MELIINPQDLGHDFLVPFRTDVEGYGGPAESGKRAIKIEGSVSPTAALPQLL